MSTVTIRFNRVVVNSSEQSTDNEHLGAEVDYVILVNGANLGFYKSSVRATPGSDMSQPLEVTLPDGYSGPMDYAAFREAVERYVRTCVGPEGRGVRMPWETMLQMTDVIFGFPHEESFEAADR